MSEKTEKLIESACLSLMLLISIFIIGYALSGLFTGYPL